MDNFTIVWSMCSRNTVNVMCIDYLFCRRKQCINSEGKVGVLRTVMGRYTTIN